MDSDDKWFPNKLENQLSLLAEHPEIDVLGCAFDGLYLNNVPEGTLLKIEINDLIFKIIFNLLLLL